MTQIAKKWIADRAVDSSKLDSLDSYTMAGLTVTGAASIAGNMDFSGDATVGGNLQVDGDTVVQSLESSGGVTVNSSVDGQTLLLLNTSTRPWEFKQGSAGSGTYLNLQAANTGKKFVITSPNNTPIVTFYPNNSGDGTTYFGGRVAIGTPTSAMATLSVDTSKAFNTALDEVGQDSIHLVNTSDGTTGGSISFNEPNYTGNRGAAIASIKTNSALTDPARADQVGLAFYTSPSTNPDPMTLDHSGNLSVKSAVDITSIGDSTKRSLLSVDQMQLSQLDGGAFFGRTGIKENQLSIGSIGASWILTPNSNPVSGIAMSADGRIQASVVTGTYIQISMDYGLNWVNSAYDTKYWVDIVMSADGKIMAAVTNEPDNIFVSTDYGATWKSRAYNRYYTSVAMSADGRIITAVTSTGGIFTSYDFGVTFTNNPLEYAWTCAAMSSDGKIQVAAVDNWKIKASVDFGVTWNTINADHRLWRSVAVSADGRNIVACVYDDYIYTSNDYGTTWAVGSIQKYWTDVVMSADGKTMVACATTGSGENIYASTDCGVTWSQVTDFIDKWTSIAMSSDGKVVAAGTSTGGVYESYASSVTHGAVVVSELSTGLKKSLVSMDQMQLSQLEGGAYFGRTGIKENQWDLANFGAEWKNVLTPSAVNGVGSAMSSDGKVQAVCIKGDDVYVSLNHGVTWSAVSPTTPPNNWTSIAMSADGKIMAATAQSDSIYVSVDYGSTWSTTASALAWASVAMSADGRIITAVAADPEYIYVSTNYGGTWTQRASSASWTSVAMSSDGKIQLAGCSGASLYSSKDYGLTWSVMAGSLSDSWSSVAMSADGKIMAACINGDYVYVSTNYGLAWGAASVPSSNWSSVAISADGRVIVACDISDDNVYFSTNYGTAWSSVQVATAYSVAMSSDGKVMLVGSDTSIYVSYTGSVNRGIVEIKGSEVITELSTGLKKSLLSVDQMQLSQLEGGAYFGKTAIKESPWDLDKIGVNWVDSGLTSTSTGVPVAISSNGKIMAAVVHNDLIYVSLNYGVDGSWISAGSALGWKDIAMSADGKIMAAVADDPELIYVSTDYGATWAPYGSSAVWNSIAMSADGRVMAATVSSDYMYISTDYGVTWVQRDASRLWLSVAMSSDGKIITGVTNNQYIHTSYDYGITWVASSENGALTNVAMSADGKIQAAVQSGSHKLWLSTDYGATWANTFYDAHYWVSVAVSADGRTIIGTTNSSGHVYVTTDGGTTWAVNNPVGASGLWYTAAMSSDGRVVVVSNASKTYVSMAKSTNYGIISASSNIEGRSSTFTHVVTGVANDDVYGLIKPITANYGGIDIVGIENRGRDAVNVRGIQNENTGSYPAVRVVGSVWNDFASDMTMASDGLLLSVDNFDTPVLEVKGNGDTTVGGVLTVSGVISARSENFTNPVTDVAASDVYGLIKYVTDADGGVEVVGIRTSPNNSVHIQGIQDGNSGTYPAIKISGSIYDGGTGITGMASNGLLLSVDNYDTPVLKVKGNGDTTVSGSLYTSGNMGAGKISALSKVTVRGGNSQMGLTVDSSQGYAAIQVNNIMTDNTKLGIFHENDPSNAPFCHDTTSVFRISSLGAPMAMVNLNGINDWQGMVVDTTGGVFFLNLPSSNPEVLGQLYVDTFQLMISGGPLACPYLYINGVYFDEVLRNLKGIDKLSTESTEISKNLNVGVNELEIKEEKSEITYFNKLSVLINGEESVIFENKIFNKCNTFKFTIEKKSDSDVVVLLSTGYYDSI